MPTLQLASPPGSLPALASLCGDGLCPSLLFALPRLEQQLSSSSSVA